jgi:hypothetical protein
VKVEVSYKLWGKVQVEVAVPDYDALTLPLDSSMGSVKRDKGYEQ